MRVAGRRIVGGGAFLSILPFVGQKPSDVRYDRCLYLYLELVWELGVAREKHGGDI